jgi:hypothetical protein
MSAGGGRCPLPQPRVCMDGRRPAAAVSPPCSGGCGPSAVDSGRPASIQPHADTAAVSASADTCWGSALGPRSRRQRRSARSDGGRGWWTPAAAGARALRTPATAAASCSPYGNATLDSRRHNRPPPPLSDQERDRRVRQRPTPPWPDRQIRSLVLCVGLVGSRRIWPAHVACPVGPDGSRRILSDRLDDQTDDQTVGRGALGTPCHNDYCGAGTRYSIWRCLADRRDSEQRAPDCKPADNRPLGAGVCRRGGSGRVGRPALRSGVPRVALWNDCETARWFGDDPGRERWRWV